MYIAWLQIILEQQEYDKGRSLPHAEVRANCQ